MGSIGWFGIPGGPACRSTKTHVVREGKPICGARLGKNMEFQWCSHEDISEPGCDRCKVIQRMHRRKALEKELESLKVER